MNYQLKLLHNFNIISSENGAFEKYTYTHWRFVRSKGFCYGGTKYWLTALVCADMDPDGESAIGKHLLRKL